MFNNEELVLGEGTENAEDITAEQNPEEVEPIADEPSEQPKTYTQEDFEREVEKRTNERVDKALGKKLARKEAKIRKEYEEKYGPLEHVLKAGTGKQDVGEITDDFRHFYEKKGIKIPTEPRFSERDICALAKSDAEEIISLGFDEVVEEINRLSKVGVKNMSEREKQTFKILAENRQNAERQQEFDKLGVGKEIYDSVEFKDFASQFTTDTPVAKIYEIYSKMQPKKEIKSPGSMKSTAQEGGVKDYYSYEEATKFTREEIRSNPQLFKALERSMPLWGKKK